MSYCITTVHTYIHTYIYIFTGVTSKLSPFSIINSAYVLYLFQVLSTVQQTRFRSALSVRKAALWCNSLIQKSISGKQYCLTFTLEAPIWRFLSVWMSIWIQIHIHIDKSKLPVHIIVFGVILSDDVMPAFIFLHDLRLIIEAYIKHLWEVVLAWIAREAAGRSYIWQ